MILSGLPDVVEDENGIGYVYGVNCGMNINRYPYRLKWVNVEYEFESIGRRGVIKKIVKYLTIRSTDEKLLSLSLGDWNEQLRCTQYDVRSENGDTDLVLATVASICVDMLSLRQSSGIYLEGETPARNRLFRTGIIKNWNHIGKVLEIDGLRSGKWEPFQPNINYDAFRARLRYT